MKNNIFIIRGLGVFVVLLLAGCWAAPDTRYYTLRGIENPEVIRKTDYPYDIGIGPVIMPEMLIHPGLVSLSKDQGVEVSMYRLWAGRLSLMFQRVMTDNVSRILDIDAVWPFPWDNRSRPKRQVRVIVEEFFGVIGGDVHLKAKWIISTNNGEIQLLTRGETFTQLASSDSYMDYVEALNAVLNMLSVEIAQSLLEAG